MDFMDFHENFNLKIFVLHYYYTVFINLKLLKAMIPWNFTLKYLGYTAYKCVVRVCMPFQKLIISYLLNNSNFSNSACPLLLEIVHLTLTLT